MGSPNSGRTYARLVIRTETLPAWAAQARFSHRRDPESLHFRIPMIATKAYASINGFSWLFWKWNISVEQARVIKVPSEQIRDRNPSCFSACHDRKRTKPLRMGNRNLAAIAYRVATSPIPKAETAISIGTKSRDCPAPSQ